MSRRFHAPPSMERHFCFGENVCLQKGLPNEVEGGIIIMKKLVAKLRTMNVANYLATFAVISTVIGASSKCACFFHDVEKPDLTQFRKF